MIYKQKEFAQMCGVKPPAISDLLKRGILHAVERKIDLDDPANMAYLQKHNPKTAQDILSGHDVSSSAIVSDPGNRVGVRGPKPKQTKPSQKKLKDDLEKIKNEESQLLSAPDIPASTPRTSGYTMSYEEEVVSKRAFYEAEKIKNDAALKALELDKRNGTLIELELVEDLMTKFYAAIQKGFLDVIPKQALMICSRLGTIGRESDVEDVIADDNTRRLEDIKQIIETMARTRWGIQNRHVIKQEDELTVSAEENDE